MIKYSYSFIYKGKIYGVGTVVRIKTLYDGIQLATFQGGNNRNLFTGNFHCMNYSVVDLDDYIVEIISPVEINTPNQWSINAHQGEIELGWIWYILIMLLGTLFKDAIYIWIGATIYFIIWKSKQ